jgi:hypothetical protein
VKRYKEINIFITKINNLFVPYEIELMDDRIGQMTIKFNDDKSIRQVKWPNWKVTTLEAIK